MKRKRVHTKDGSHSFYIAELDEHYHSFHGAIQESNHVFINAGFNQFRHSQDLHILEVGFGTGLNALLTILANKNGKINIAYDAVEAYPLTMKEIESLNYTELLEVGEMQPVFIRMHDGNWGNATPIHRGFVLNKFRAQLEDIALKHNLYNLVYFDAFAPGAQPELWTEEIFRKLFASMTKDGVLVTYCAKGSVKRAMISAGFKIEKLPGPIGKREMTRAIKE